MESKHFSHHHPLTFHQMHQGSQTHCSGCKTPATGNVYVCWQCSYFLHEQCFHAKRSLKHPSHPLHPLSLVPLPTYPSSSFFCNSCNLAGDGFSYSCSACEFDIHVHCALVGNPNPNPHPHPLPSHNYNINPPHPHENPLYPPTPIQPYPPQHQPTTLTNQPQNYTPTTYPPPTAYPQPNPPPQNYAPPAPNQLPPPNQEHYPLPTAYPQPNPPPQNYAPPTPNQLPPPNQEHSPPPTAYPQQNPPPQNYAPPAANQPPSPNPSPPPNQGHYPQPNPSPQNYAPPTVNQPPPSNPNPPTPTYSTVVNATTTTTTASNPPPPPSSIIKHFSHPHVLKKMEIDQKKAKVCSACECELSGAAYCCTEPYCTFNLHKSCFDSPQELRHKSHLEHPLRLLTAPPYNDGFTCNACLKDGKAFAYNCAACSYDLHIDCVQWPDTVRRPDHKHDLTLYYSSPAAAQSSGEDEAAFMCDVCRNPVHEMAWVYYCRECDFGTHLECVASGIQQESGGGGVAKTEDELIREVELKFAVLQLLLGAQAQNAATSAV